MPDYLGVVADMFFGASVCSHARLTGTPRIGSGDLRILHDVNPDSFSQQAVVSDL